MVSLITNLFSKRELTDAELYEAYNKSEKKVKDFEIYIMQIKEGKESIALKEICGLRLSNINELEQLIEVLEKNNINKGISLSTNRDKKKLNSIYNHFKEIYYIQNNFLPDDEGLIQYIFSNKNDLFCHLRKHCENNDNLKNYIYNMYFKQNTYINILEYFLLKDFGNDVKFLFPNEENYSIIKKNNSIPNYINLSDIFYNLNNSNDIRNQINNLLLNLIIYFYTIHKDEIIVKNMNKYLPNENTEYIQIILTLYGLALKIDPKLTLKDFVNNKLRENYKNILMAEYSTFHHVLTNIIVNVKEYSNIYKDLKYLPLEILRDMIMNKAKYDLLIKAIDIIINSNEYNNISVFNFILKYLFDYYCFNKVTVGQLNKIIKYLMKYNNSFNELSNHLDYILEVITIFERYNIKFAINELINKDNIEDISKDNIYIKNVIEYLKLIIENNIDNLKFHQENIEDLNILIQYKKNLTLGRLLIYYFNLYPIQRPFILHIIYENKDYLLTKNELKALIDLYLLDPYTIQPEEYSFIENYLDDQGGMLSKDIYVQLDNLMDYLKIKSFVKKYKIRDEFFKDYTLDNYRDNIPKILNSLLIKTTKIDEIDDINIFLKSNQSKDIQAALNLTRNNYLHFLFNFLMEYKRTQLAFQIIQKLKENNKEPKYFNKCLDYVYYNIFKKNNEEFIEYCKEANIEEYILENNNKYLDILSNNTNFKKENIISFPLQRQSNDMLILYSLIKNNKIKKEKNKTCNDLMLSFDEYKKSPKEKKNLKNLIECYLKNKDDSDLNDDRINYNYSLHPKLIELLKNKNYFHIFQNLNITFKSKIHIYNFCLDNNVCSLNDIINNFENIKLKKKTKTDKDIIEKYKLLFNLYKENDEEKEIFKELCELTRQNYNDEQNKKNAILLIDFNLSNKINISFNNLLFLNKFFGYKISSSDENELKLLRLLSSSSNKINILPFFSDFNDNYLSNKNFQETLEKYYKNNINISVKENNKFFESLKGENIYSTPNIYYQSLELFKILNMSNIFTIRDIFFHLNSKKEQKANINLLFMLNIIINFFMMNSIIPSKIDYGLKNIIGILNTLDLALSDINIILEEIFFFQSVSFINNSCHNILLFNISPNISVRNFMEGKKKLADEIISIYYGENISNKLIMNYYKIFLVKSEIIKNIRDNEVVKIYNGIKNLGDLKEILEEIKDMKELKEKIYEIYNS